MNEVQYVNLENPGKCYKNSKLSPAVAEEITCGKIGKLFLLDDGGNLLSDAIFAEQIVSDGDTRGAFKLILTQEMILGTVVKDLAKPVPDIGHFIKCISNAFYKFKSENKAFDGVGMLQPLRIKSISSDISRHLRSYHQKKETVLILHL